MEAPDKIYLLSSKEGQIGNIAFEEPVFAENCGEQRNIAYIQKVVLLLWAKEKYKYYESLCSVTDDPVNWGQRNMCQQLIDKLNSM